ncbi:MAG: isochorismatase family protein [Pirellulales bacterium]|nr:isochorismatase family protein [Pirellulales bacterium]
MMPRPLPPLLLPPCPAVRMPAVSSCLWRWSLAALLAAYLCCCALSNRGAAKEPAAGGTPRPLVPGVLRLDTRRREILPEHGSQPVVVRDQQEWNAAETAIIVCDLWSNHRCRSSAERIEILAPKVNAMLSAARDHGVTIVHAPSGGISYYETTPFRRRIKQAPAFEPPVAIADVVRADVTEPPLPIDDSDGGCDDPEPHALVEFDYRQHAAIRMVGYDVVTEDGRELYNYFRQEGIKNVAILGIHTNMCVLGRSFGIRQLRVLGFNVVLCRDLTDASYDPRDYPFVSHTRGTELVVEHIETFLCPSIDSACLTRVVPGTAGP